MLIDSNHTSQNLFLKYKILRDRSQEICHPLEKEDYVVQPIPDVSPPKWHLGHTTWFFETFILKPHLANYKEYNSDYNFVFNSYYETIGARVIRTDRGNLSRPSVDDVYKYRKYVDEAIELFFETEISKDVRDIFILGINHEEQHQELLLTDIKYILGHNPLFPAYDKNFVSKKVENLNATEFLRVEEGLYEIGYNGQDFAFDNEFNRHKVWLESFEISNALVTNAQYLEFIKDGGYKNFEYWHADGWNWICENKIDAPLYWHKIAGEWHHYSFNGLEILPQDSILSHVSYYEAWAFAAWSGNRLATEAEWEVAASQFNWGKRWEWTESSYLPYPGFAKAEGAIGEYNGKFMIGQQILRGGSEYTSKNHSRITYRNFFPPTTRWQLTGIRLVK